MSADDERIDPGLSTAAADIPETRLLQLPSARSDEAVEVLVEAFHDYPVMRRVLGRREGPDEAVSPLDEPYDRRLWRLVRFFVLARVLSGHPILALETSSGLVAAATLALPGPSSPSPELDLIRSGTWAVLGSDAHARYQALGRVWETFAWPEPHHHLSMIGVLPSAAGRGLGRRLLDRVQRAAEEHPESAGVSLTTETASNVELYRHVGFEVVAQGRLPADPALGLPEIRSWGMFRPNPR